MKKEVFKPIKFDETNGCGLAKTVYDQTTKELSVLSLIERVCEKESARMSNQYEVRFDEKEFQISKTDSETTIIFGFELFNKSPK